jgi:CMP/dCMP kinase
MAVLTLSRQYGSGIREIRLRIAGALNYSYVDKESIFKEIRRRGGQWERWAEEFDESRPSAWERFDWSFIGLTAILQSVLLSHAVRDNVILAGRGTSFILDGLPHAYRIRFVAPMDQRAVRIAAWRAVDQDTAVRVAKKKDSERAGFIKAMYGKDVADPLNYDDVFDTSEHSEDQIVARVTKELVERSNLKTPEAHRSLELRAAAARVKAGLVTDAQLYVPTLEVEPAANGLVLSAVVHNANQYRQIEEAGRELAGNTPIEIRLKYRT